MKPILTARIIPSASNPVDCGIGVVVLDDDAADDDAVELCGRPSDVLVELGLLIELGFVEVGTVVVELFANTVTSTVALAELPTMS